jgi:UDP-N-acetylglucosamine transferase subunit ALG13
MAEAVNAVLPSLPKPVIIQAGANAAYFHSGLGEVEVFETCSYAHFSELVVSAELVITHGGVGAAKESINSGLRPAVFVRQHSKNEHIDDHQVEWCNLLFAQGLAQECVDSESLEAFLANGQFKQYDLSVGLRFFNCDALKADLHQYIHSVIDRR